MPASLKLSRSQLRRESILLGSLLLCGLLVLPLAIYFIGYSVFGAYADGNLFAFLAALYSRVLSADLSAWFLVFMPYLLWQSLRLALAGARRRPRSA